MKRTILIILSILLVLGCDDKEREKRSAQLNKIPIRDFFRNPEKTNFKLSPDGTHFSYLAPYKKRMNIFIQQFGSDSSKRVTSETEQDISFYYWASDNRLLFAKDKKGDENYKLYGIDTDGGNLRLLNDFKGMISEIIDDLKENPDEILIGLNKRDLRVFDVYRLNVHTGEVKIEVKNPGNIQKWMTDHEGKVRLAIASDGLDNKVMYRKGNKGPFRDIMTVNYRNSVRPIFFTFDNKHFYASSNMNRDKMAIVEIDPETGEEVKVIYQNPLYDVKYLSYSPKRKKLEYAAYYSWKLEYEILDPEIEEMMQKLEHELSNYEIAEVSRDLKEEKFIIRTYSDRSMGAYYLYNSLTDEISIMNEVSPWLLEQDLCDMKPVTYESRDGLTIHGYLILPKNTEPKDLPAVVVVHGGPWTRVNWGFEPDMQFLANRGFAVFIMNYRGSTGYGRKFWEASFKEWGRKLQNDITDGAKWLIEKGIADPGRIAIYGGSFGGYASLAGVTFTPDLYKCGVSYVGVTNLITYINSVPPYYQLFLEKLYSMVGHPEKDSLLLVSASPFFHTDKVKVPVLIAIGANDRWVSKIETDLYVSKLRKNGVDVEYMVKENEGHGFRKEENRIEFFTRVEAFLEKHLLMKNNSEK